MIEYILGNIWHFIGFIIILCVCFEGIADIVKAWRNK